METVVRGFLHSQDAVCGTKDPHQSLATSGVSMGEGSVRKVVTGIANMYIFLVIVYNYFHVLSHMVLIDTPFLLPSKLEVTKFRHREVKQVVHGHTASKEHRWD